LISRRVPPSRNALSRNSEAVGRRGHDSVASKSSPTHRATASAMCPRRSRLSSPPPSIRGIGANRAASSSLMTLLGAAAFALNAGVQALIAEARTSPDSTRNRSSRHSQTFVPTPQLLLRPRTAARRIFSGLSRRMCSSPCKSTGLALAVNDFQLFRRPHLPRDGVRRTRTAVPSFASDISRLSTSATAPRMVPAVRALGRLTPIVGPETVPHYHRFSLRPDMADDRRRLLLGPGDRGDEAQQLQSCRAFRLRNGPHHLSGAQGPARFATISSRWRSSSSFLSVASRTISWTMPFMVLPPCLLALFGRADLALAARRADRRLFQIGFVMP